MDRFVVGFAFTENKKSVLLVIKNRPEWQKGCLNGIGGKIESGETSHIAMSRESKEEAGLVLEWHRRGAMRGVNNDGSIFECHIFYAFDDKVLDFIQKEDEVLGVWPTNQINRFPHISNLEFLIPFGVCDDHSKFLRIDY